MEIAPGCRSLKLQIFNKPLYTEQMYPYDSRQCLFLADAFLETKDGERIPLSGLPIKCQNIDSGYGIGKDYEGGRVLIEGEEYPDAIPFSTIDHDKWGTLQYDLSGMCAVRLTGLIGVDNFPGEEAQRRRTYGVGQNAIYGRFITVIEPHEGQRCMKRVEGLSENKVRISYGDGKWQEVEIEEIDGEPEMLLRSYENGCLISVEHT